MRDSVRSSVMWGHYVEVVLFRLARCVRNRSLAEGLLLFSPCIPEFIMSSKVLYGVIIPTRKTL